VRYCSPTNECASSPHKMKCMRYNKPCRHRDTFPIFESSCFCYALRPPCGHFMCVREHKGYTLAHFLERVADILRVEQSFYIWFSHGGFGPTFSPPSSGGSFVPVCYNIPYRQYELSVSRFLGLRSESAGRRGKWMMKGAKTLMFRLHSFPKTRFKSPSFDSIEYKWPFPKYGGTIIPRVYR